MTLEESVLKLLNFKVNFSTQLDILLATLELDNCENKKLGNKLKLSLISLKFDPDLLFTPIECNDFKILQLQWLSTCWKSVIFNYPILLTN